MRRQSTVVLPHVGRRIAEAVDNLARVNATPKLGGSRQVFSRVFAAGISFVERSMRDVGLETRIDPFGNLIGRWDQLGGSAPVVLEGSLVDTTLNAGRFDGVVGVRVAVEAVRLLHQHGFQPHHPIEVVAVAGEPRFGLGCIGSRAMVGQPPRPDQNFLRDRSITSPVDALREAGHDPDRLKEAVAPGPGRQGIRRTPRRAGCGTRAAACQSASSSASRLRTTCECAYSDQRCIRGDTHGDAARCDGRSGRGGCGDREDCRRVAELDDRQDSRRCTSPARSGRCHPGIVEMEVDFRDSGEAARGRLVAWSLDVLEEICSRRVLEHEEMACDTPQACDPMVIAAVRAAVCELGVESLPMISGAYHDAAPRGTLSRREMFVPSAGGLSHSPEEYTSPTDMAHGVFVLAPTISAFASKEEEE